MAQKLIAEFIGTFALLFLGAGAAVMTGLGIGSLTTVAFAHGFTILVSIYAFSEISGTHINPAVTLALAIANKFAWKEVIPYIIAQLIGAIVAGFAMRYVYGGPVEDLGATLVNYELTTWGGAAILEMFGTFFMVTTIFHTAVAGRAGNLAPIAIACSVMGCIFFFGPLTGASLNPARTIGPAIAAGVYTDIGMYMFTTCGGAVLAALLYRRLFD